MKSHPRELSPDLQRIIRQEVEKQMVLERGYIAQCMMLLAMDTLYIYQGWGAVRLERFAEQYQCRFGELTENFGFDCWYDKILADLSQAKVEVRTDGWDLERQRKIDTHMDKSPVLTAEQIRKLKAFRGE